LPLRRAICAGDFFEAERVLRRPVLEAGPVSVLISELRRLRALLRDIAPYLDDDPQGQTGPKREREIRQLQARLRAEMDTMDGLDR
jgi:hypothetical protein